MHSKPCSTTCMEGLKTYTMGIHVMHMLLREGSLSFGFRGSLSFVMIVRLGRFIIVVIGAIGVLLIFLLNFIFIILKEWHNFLSSHTPKQWHRILKYH